MKDFLNLKALKDQFFGRKKQTPVPAAESNARFLSDHPDPIGALLRDLQEGLRYTLNGTEKTFAWRTSFQELESEAFFSQITQDEYGWRMCHFDFPFRLGALEIKGLKINLPDPERMSGFRTDMPVDCFPFKVRLDGNGAGNYRQLKAYFSEALGAPQNNWERDDELHSDWDIDGINLGITYWFRSYTSDNESGYALLNLNNQRIFPEFFTDEYLQHFSLDAPDLVVQCFELRGVSVSNRCRTSPWVRFTPPAIRELLVRENRELALWHDNRQQMLGLAMDARFCLVIDLKTQPQLRLQEVDMDRGQVVHELQQFSALDEQGETLLSTSPGGLDQVADWLKHRGIQI